MKFNTDKCHILHVGRTNPKYSYSLGNSKLTSVEEERDLGVIIENTLKNGRQCERAARSANGVLSQILRAFSYRDKKVLPSIFKTYVRPHLEFAAPVWNPHRQSDIETLEKVQIRLVKSIQGLSGTSYEEKLSEIGLETLEMRRRKLDLIQAHKFVKNEDNTFTDFFQVPEDRPYATRRAMGGNIITQHRSRLELRANFFSQRVIAPWNALPPNTRGAPNVQSFKRCLKAGVTELN